MSIFQSAQRTFKMFNVQGKNDTFLNENVRLIKLNNIVFMPLVQSKEELCTLVKKFFGMKGYVRYFPRYFYNRRFIYQPAFFARKRELFMSNVRQIETEVKTYLPKMRNAPSFRYMDNKNMILDYTEQFKLMFPKSRSELTRPQLLAYAENIFPEIITRMAINDEPIENFKYTKKYQTTQARPVLQMRHKTLILPIEITLTNPSLIALFLNPAKALMRGHKTNPDIIKNLSLIRFIYKLYIHKTSEYETTDESERFFLDQFKNHDVRFILHNKKFAFTVDFKDCERRKMNTGTFYQLYRQRLMTLINNNVGLQNDDSINLEIENENKAEQEEANKVTVEVVKDLGNPENNTKSVTSTRDDKGEDINSQYNRKLDERISKLVSNQINNNTYSKAAKKKTDSLLKAVDKSNGAVLDLSSFFQDEKFDKNIPSYIKEEPKRIDASKRVVNESVIKRLATKQNNLMQKLNNAPAGPKFSKMFDDEFDDEELDENFEIEEDDVVEVDEEEEVEIKEEEEKDIYEELKEEIEEEVIPEEQSEEEESIPEEEDFDDDINNDLEEIKDHNKHEEILKEIETDSLTIEEEEELYKENRDYKEDSQEISDKARREILEELAKKQEPKRSPKEQRRVILIRDKYKSIKTQDNRTLEEVLSDAEAKEIKVNKIEDNTILDQTVTTSRLQDFEKSYIEKTLQQDIINTIRSFSDENKTTPLHIIDYKEEDSSDRQNIKKTLTFKLEDETRRRHTIKFDLPIPDEDGFLFINGDKKVLKKQIIPLPLMKVAPNRVILSSFDNKIIMEREGTVLNRKVIVVKKLIEDYLIKDRENFVIKYGDNIIRNNEFLTPLEYDDLAKSYHFIEIGKQRKIKVFFNQKEIRSQIKKDFPDYNFTVSKLPYILDYEKKIVIDFDLNNPEDSIANMIIDIIRTKGMIANFDNYINSIKVPKRRMFTNLNLQSHIVPLIAYLGAIWGIRNVLKVSRIKYTFSSKPIRGDQRLSIRFMDGILYYDELPLENSLLINGLNKINTEDYKFDDFDTEVPYVDYLYLSFKSRNMLKGWTSFKELFIDHITRGILEDHKLPTDLLELLLYANDMLADNSFTHETRSENYRIRGYEILSVILYKAIAREYKILKQKGDSLRASLSIPQDVVIGTLYATQIVENVETINPINEMKTKAVCTYKGNKVGGTKMQYSSLESRAFADDSIGIFAISNVDNHQIGITKELTTNPRIINTRGYLEPTEDKQEINQMGAGELQAPEELITPSSVKYDHPNRVGFSSGQWKHTLGVRDNCLPFVMTGYERVLPKQIGNTYVRKSSKPGEIIDINDELKQITIQHKSGTVEVLEYGKDIVRNSNFFLKNNLILNCSIGDKVTEHDILAYADDFFLKQGNDVVFSQGTMAKVAIMDTFFTEEDSSLISSHMAKKMSNPVIQRKQVTISKNANIIRMVKIGDYVRTGDPLLIFEDEENSKETTELLEAMGDVDVDAMESLMYHSPKAPSSGYISKIDIYWSVDIKEMSNSCTKLVNSYIKSTKERVTYIEKHTKKPSRLRYNLNKTSLNNGRINGAILPEEGGILIEFFIEDEDDMAAGWKLSFQPAIKSIIAQVTPQGQDPFTESGPLDAVCGMISISNRQVNSTYLIGMAGKILHDMTKKIADEYLK